MITPSISSVKTALLYTFTMIVTISALYEILEWFAVLLFHPGLGTAFLGTQGDVWDAQQDTLVATIGALINMAFYQSYEKLLHHNR
jgi:putative membrane protein